MDFKIGNYLKEIDAQNKKVKDYGYKLGDGGYPLPNLASNNLLKLASEGSIVRGRAIVIECDPEMPNAGATIPVLKQGDNGVFGKMQLRWLGENINDDNDLILEVEDETLKPNDVGGFVAVNDKTLSNSSGASMFIENLIKEAIIEAEDEKFLVGTGINCPLGVINCPGAMNIQRSTISRISYIDTVEMMSLLPPETLNSGNALYVANQSAFKEITTMTDGNGNLAYKDGKINNITVKWTDKTPSLGQRGDLMLCDFRYYIIKDSDVIRVNISNHSNFKKNQSLIRVIWSVDGQGIVREPLKLRNGNEVSPFVILE